jgi:hypothetical protein
MSPIIIVDNEYITLRYLPDKRIIYHTIHKPIDGQPLKDALNAGTEALKQYGACKWLSDDRKNGPLSQEMLDWGLKDWDPRTIAAGWKYWANVVPQELSAAGTLMPLIQILYDMGLRMMVFTDLENAIQWLDSMKG